MLAIGLLGAVGGVGLGLKAGPLVILTLAGFFQCLLLLFLAAGAAIGNDSWPGILFAVASVLSGILPLRLRYAGSGAASVRWLAALPAALVILSLAKISATAELPPILFIFFGAPPCLLAAAVWRPFQEPPRRQIEDPEDGDSAG